jgi:hypothetical protein
MRRNPLGSPLSTICPLLALFEKCGSVQFMSVVGREADIRQRAKGIALGNTPSTPQRIK